MRRALLRDANATGSPQINWAKGDDMSARTAVVIDDEVDLTNYMSSILEEHGFVVHTANDAAEGEVLVREKTPDIVLIDLMMPGRSGVQLLARLRRNEATKGIPLVMVTGIKDKMGIDWGKAADEFKSRTPDGFLEKPIDEERLMKVVEGVLSGVDRGGEVLHG
jgi:CheY-like chemotaxis protein